MFIQYLSLALKQSSAVTLKDFLKKRRQKCETDAAGFIEEANQLLDVHQKDHKKLAEIEKKFLLKMTDEDYMFYKVSITSKV